MGAYDEVADRLMEETEAAIEAHGLHVTFEEPVTLRRHRYDYLPGVVPATAVSGCIDFLLDIMGVCFKHRPDGCPLSCWPHALVEINRNSYIKCCPIMLADVLGIKIKGINT